MQLEAPLPPNLPLGHRPLQPRPGEPAWPKRPGGQIVPLTRVTRGYTRVTSGSSICSVSLCIASSSERASATALRTCTSATQGKPAWRAFLALPARLVFHEASASAWLARGDVATHYGCFGCLGGYACVARCGRLAKLAARTSKALCLAKLSIIESRLAANTCDRTSGAVLPSSTWAAAHTARRTDVSTIVPSSAWLTHNTTNRVGVLPCRARIALRAKYCALLAAIDRVAFRRRSPQPARLAK